MATLAPWGGRGNSHLAPVMGAPLTLALAVHHRGLAGLADEGDGIGRAVVVAALRQHRLDVQLPRLCVPGTIHRPLPAVAP